MNLKSIAFGGAAVVMALVLSLGLMVKPASAATTVTLPAATTIALTTNATNGSQAWTNLAGNIVLNGAAIADFPVGTIVVSAPTGWQFNTAVTADVVYTVNGGALAGNAGVTYATDGSTMTITVTAASTTVTNVITVGGVTKPQLRPISNTAASGNITFNAAASTGDPVGLADGTSVAGITAGAALTAPYTMSLNMVATSTACPAGPFIVSPSVAADGSQSQVLCARLLDTNGAAVSNAPIAFSVSLGVVSTGTAKTTTAFTGTTGGATTNYRGGGNIAATDTAIASNTSYNAVGTLSIGLTVPTGNTASKIVVNAPSILAIAANVTNTSPGYVSPNTGADGAIQVTDSAGLGVNGQVVLITVDRGAIVANAGFGTALATACNGATSKSITGTTVSAAATRGAGTNTAGVVTFAVCGNQTDAAGKLTITAQNVSTSMANATTSISMAGRPAKVEATATGNAISAKVTDAGGNAVADGTPIRFTISQNAGAVSTACTTSTNGQATSVVSLIAATGTVIVSTDWNETGAVAGCGAGAAGAQQAAVSVTVPGGTASSGTPSTPSTPSAGSVTSGSVPAAGGFGFFVYGGPVSGLAAATGCPSGTAAFWATVNGEFVTNVPGTTISAVNAAFNAAFPNGIPAGTALLGKCK